MKNLFIICIISLNSITLLSQENREKILLNIQESITEGETYRNISSFEINGEMSGYNKVAKKSIQHKTQEKLSKDFYERILVTKDSSRKKTEVTYAYFEKQNLEGDDIIKYSLISTNKPILIEYKEKDIEVISDIPESDKVLLSTQNGPAPATFSYAQMLGLDREQFIDEEYELNTDRLLESVLLNKYIFEEGSLSGSAKLTRLSKSSNQDCYAISWNAYSGRVIGLKEILPLTMKMRGVLHINSTSTICKSKLDGFYRFNETVTRTSLSMYSYDKSIIDIKFILNGTKNYTTELIKK